MDRTDALQQSLETQRAARDGPLAEQEDLLTSVLDAQRTACTRVAVALEQGDAEVVQCKFDVTRCGARTVG